MLPMRVSVRQPDGTTITYIPVVTEAELQHHAALRASNPELNGVPPTLPTASRQDIPTAHALTYSRAKSRSKPKPVAKKIDEEKEEESSEEEEEGPAINLPDLHKGGEKQIIRPSGEAHFVPPPPPTLDVSQGIRFEHKKTERKKTKTLTHAIYDEEGSGAKNVEKEVNEIKKTKETVGTFCDGAT